MAVAQGAVSRGYKTQDTDLQQGMLVASVPNSSDAQLVERASDANIQNFLGVMTTVESSLLTVTDKTNNIIVTDAGPVEVYVSDINGEVKKGDSLTLSPLKGVAMRADQETTFIIGVAVADFDSQAATPQSVKAENQDRSAKVAKLKIQLDPKVIVAKSKNNSSNFYVSFGKSLTGKAVSSTQVIIAMVIFLVLIGVEGVIIYSTVRSSIISLGRNPLSYKTVYNGLIFIVLVVLFVLLLGMGSIYAVLWA